MDNNTLEQLYTIDEAYAITKRKPSTWRRDILLRKIKVVRIGRSVRIPVSEIARLIKDGTSRAIGNGER